MYQGSFGAKRLIYAIWWHIGRPSVRTRRWTAEKLEGLAVAADGQVYIVTDNDGVDEATGETLFFNLGNWLDAFGF